MENLKIKIVMGSVREGRFCEKAAHWVFEELKKRGHIEVELLDLKDYEMPFFKEAVTPSSLEKPYEHEAVARFTKKIAEADGFIVVTPEYNHGYPAVLKNALDYVYKEWNKKPVGFVSYGSVGGARAVEQLRQVAVELQMVPTRNAVHISAPWGLLDEKGSLKEGAFAPFEKKISGLFDELVSYALLLKGERD